MMQTQSLNRQGQRWLGDGLGKILRLAFLAELVSIVVYLLIGQHYGSYWTHVCEWDCNWYREIAERGYDRRPNTAGYANWAFFPLFPLITRVVMLATSDSFVVSASIVNAVAFFGIIVMTMIWCQNRYGLRSKSFGVAALVAFPFGIWFRLPYTESLYGLLTIATLLLVGRRQLILAGILAGLACLCRSTGILLVGSIGLVGLTSAVSDVVRHRILLSVAVRRIGMLALFGFLSSLGLLAYMAYLNRTLGDPLAFSHAMGAWNRHYGNPIERVLSGFQRDDLSLKNFLSSTYRSQTYLAVSAVLSVVLIGWGLWLGAFVEAIFLMTTLLVSTSTGLESQPRYMFCNPVAMALITLASAKLPAGLRWGLVAVFGLVQALLVSSWFRQSAFMT